MSRISLVLIALVLPSLLLVDATPACAQTSAAELLEQARARSRDMEELKAVLNGPDQNMRLATFDVMVNSGDNAIREIAIDLGLASADPLLQGMAFREAFLSLDRVIMTLEIDKSQPESIQKAAQAYLDAKGNTYTMPIAEVDKKAGTFTIYSSYTGQVTGTSMNFTYNYDSGQLELIDETTIRGPIKIYSSGYGGFIATAKIR